MAQTGDPTGTGKGGHSVFRFETDSQPLDFKINVSNDKRRVNVLS